MAIRRYVANADTTITNAYKQDLVTRGTGSNMGASDVSEIFTIYGQASTSSAEKARILTKFPTSDISTDRTNGTIPVSGSVSFYLRLYNTPHSQTLPKNYDLYVSAISSSWEEGTGLDMEGYTDKTRNETGANWEIASSGSVAASATEIIDLASYSTNDDFNITVPSEAGGTGSAIIIRLTSADNTGETSADEGVIGIGVNSGPSAATVAEAIVDAINGYVGGTGTYSHSIAYLVDSLSSGIAGVTATLSSTTKITLTATTEGNAGNRISVANGIGDAATAGKLTGGSGAWASAGGDYFTDTSSSFTASFVDGTEDMELDITTLVEQWISSSDNRATPVDMGSKANYGVILRFPPSNESETKSFYTKKFFARGTEFWHSRPVLEARWDSSTKDDAGNFYLSSSIATAEDNLNTIYLYNNIRGQLKNIPGIDGASGKDKIMVSIYSGSADNTTTSGTALPLPPGGGVVTDGHFNVTGAYVATGTYSASFAYASSSITTIFPVWHSGSAPVAYHTGSGITVNTINSSDYNPSPSYVTTITNLKNVYSRHEEARFRIYVREKDWGPTIYTKAKSDPDNTIIEDGYYRIYRTIDNLDVVRYGTGSINHTRLSFDVSGNYFDLPVNILEKGYMYGIKLTYKLPNGLYKEQAQTFKFRVE
jgi:hypothetical protein